MSDALTVADVARLVDGRLEGDGARRATGVIFIGVGVYYCLVYVFRVIG